MLEISQNSQENTCARVSFLAKLQAGTEWSNTLKQFVGNLQLTITRVFKNTSNQLLINDNEFMSTTRDHKIFHRDQMCCRKLSTFACYCTNVLIFGKKNENSDVWKARCPVTALVTFNLSFSQWKCPKILKLVEFYQYLRLVKQKRIYRIISKSPCFSKNSWKNNTYTIHFTSF